MAHRSCQRSRFDPHWLLPLVCSTLAQRHESIVKRFALSSQDNHRVAPRAASGYVDYQQLKIISEMTQEFFLPTQINPCSTVREDSGLAMSSRNTLCRRRPMTRLLI